MNMIEKVAEAIRDNIAAALPDGVIVDYRYAAIAAIEAMRTPSKAMLDAGVKFHIEDWRDRHQSLLEQWQAAIDAALNEETACPASSKSQTGHRAD